MTPALECIRFAYDESQDQWGASFDASTGALAVSEALVDAGLCIDSHYGEASLEARIARVIEGMRDKWEAFAAEDVAVDVALALNLATTTECHEWTGRAVL